jgi:hypothetical protein
MATDNLPTNIKTGKRLKSGIIGVSTGHHSQKVCFQFPTHFAHRTSQFWLDSEEVPKSWAILDRNEDGYPVLPPRPHNALLPEIKNAVREFVKAVHSKDLFDPINTSLAYVISQCFRKAQHLFLGAK